jgi:hypothetical protein
MLAVMRSIPASVTQKYNYLREKALFIELNTPDSRTHLQISGAGVFGHLITL